MLDNYVNKNKAIAIYTDGSKIPNTNSVGSAYMCKNPVASCKKNIHLLASIFTAEFVALNEAMDFALQNTESNILIFTDSRSAFQKLKSYNVNI